MLDGMQRLVDVAIDREELLLLEVGHLDLPAAARARSCQDECQEQDSAGRRQPLMELAAGMKHI